MTQRHQGDANHTALLDAQGNWIAILQLNGEMTTTQQDELLASILRGYNHYETMHQALLKARQHIIQLSQTVNTLSERQGLGQNVRALDCHEELDAALACTQVKEGPPMTYEHRVMNYETEGLTTSDAQAVCDAEDLKLTRTQDAAPALLTFAQRMLAVFDDPETGKALERVVGAHTVATGPSAIARAEGRREAMRHTPIP
ncbi:MAG: hypothetical protein ABL983_00150 [Nitrospira sp.]